MYKVLKGRGNIANITVENTDTKARVIIGKPTMSILTILDREGYSPSTSGSKHIELTDEWNFEVSNEAGKLLAKEAFKMKRPPRIKKDTTTSEHKGTDTKKAPVDVFDLIFGIKDEEF